MAKITTERLRQLKAGEKMTYKMDHPKDLNNARSTASYTQLSYPELGVVFSVCVNRPKMEVTIEAVSTKKKK